MIYNSILLFSSSIKEEKMKKFCLILCLFVLLFSLLSCSNGDGDGEKNTGTAATTGSQTQPQGITLDNTAGISVSVNGNAKLTAINLATGNETANVMWSSDNTEVATVDISGNVRGVSDGTATITATSIDGKYTASCQVTVSSVVTGIGLDQSEIRLDVGESAQIFATIYPIGVKNNGISWTSSMESVASVSQDGTVRALSNGMTSIIAKSLDGDYIASCSVTVVTPVAEIRIGESDLMLNKGVSSSLTYTISPVDASDKTLVWSSSDESVAAVIDGRVTAIGAGKATITATAINGVSGKCEITVTSPVLGVTLNYNELTLNIGDLQQLIATVNPTDADVKDVIWSSADPSVVAIDSDSGTLKAMSAGNTVITVMTVEGSFTADCYVRVIKPISAITIEGNYHELFVGNTLQLVENIIPADAEPEELVWASTDESIATVSPTGLVTAVSHGTVVVTVTSKYGAVGSCTINSIDPSMLSVDVTEVRVSKDFVVLYVGEKYELEITVLPENASNKNITFDVSNDACVSIKDNVVSAVAPGLITITVKTSNPGVTADIIVQIKNLSEEEIAAKIAEYQNEIKAENDRYDKAVGALESEFNKKSKELNDILLSSGVSGKEEYETQKALLTAQLLDYQKIRDEAELNGNTEVVNEYNELINSTNKKLSNLEGDYKTRLKIEAELKDLRDQYTEDKSKEDVIHNANISAIEYDYQFIKPYITDPEPEQDPES